MPDDPRRAAATSPRIAAVDFAPIKAGLGGYCWIFPSPGNDVPLISGGIAVCAPDCARSGQQARSFLVEWLASQGLSCDPSSIRGHGGISYDPDARIGGPRVCLAGDAAGIDPFLCEGIPCALATGIAAADAAIEASDRKRLRPDPTPRARAPEADRKVHGEAQAPRARPVRAGPGRAVLQSGAALCGLTRRSRTDTRRPTTRGWDRGLEATRGTDDRSSRTGPP